MLVGCLDGQIHHCKLGGASKVLLELEGGVIHMRFNHVRQVCVDCKLSAKSYCDNIMF